MPKPIKVLLIESDAPTARALQETIASIAMIPADVTCAERFADGLNHLGTNPRVDVIFVDVCLPDSQALEAFVRAHTAAPLASIILLAAQEDEAAAVQIVQMGAQDYLLRTECDSRNLARVLRYALERKKALDELRERREFSRLISQNVTDFIMVLDKEGRRVYQSPSYKCVINPPEFVKGSTTFLEVHPEDRDRVQQALRETLATGVGQRLEYRFLLKDGTVRFVEAQANVIKDRAGKPSKTVVVSRDMTEHKQAEKALRESERRNKQLLSSTTDYIFTVEVADGQSVATTHGPGCAALTGYTQEDFAGNSHLWLSMVPAEDRPEVLAQVARLLQGETPSPIEHRLIRKGGTIRWILNTSVPRKDEHGKVIGYDGLISDITERKQAEERLKIAYDELARSEEALRKTLLDLHASHEKLKATQFQLIQAEKFESIGTLAAGVAHEVKNPLQTILMGLAYLSNNVPRDNENVQMAVTDIRDAVKRADTIVRELLTLSSATRIEMKDEDFGAMISRSLWLVNYEVNAARIHLAPELSPVLPPVRMDSRRMEQVFINLFLNAIQAMPDGGTLSVRTRTESWHNGPPLGEKRSSQIRPGDSVVLAEVRDTGVGIAEKNLKRIFDPFFTTNRRWAPGPAWASVAKQIIDLHGGLIDVRNAPDRGVQVTIVLKAQNNATP